MVLDFFLQVRDMDGWRGYIMEQDIPMNIDIQKVFCSFIRFSQARTMKLVCAVSLSRTQGFAITKHAPPLSSCVMQKQTGHNKVRNSCIESQVQKPEKDSHDT